MANTRIDTLRQLRQAGNGVAHTVGPKRKPPTTGRQFRRGRGERIRTSDPVVPNDVRYQAALRPDSTARYGKAVLVRPAVYAGRKGVSSKLEAGQTADGVDVDADPARRQGAKGQGMCALRPFDPRPSDLPSQVALLVVVGRFRLHGIFIVYLFGADLADGIPDHGAAKPRRARKP